MKTKLICLFIFLSHSFLFLPSVLAADVSAKMIALSCHTCHGIDNQLVNPGLPKLNLQPVLELEDALLGFKYDKKPSTIMGRISKGYTDRELRAVALYFSHLK